MKRNVDQEDCTEKDESVCKDMSAQGYARQQEASLEVGSQMANAEVPDGMADGKP